MVWSRGMYWYYSGGLRVYGKDELLLVELDSHLCTEDSLKMQDNDKLKGNNIAGPLVVNMVEHENSSRYNDNIVKHKHHNTKAYPNKKPKVTCWKYGRPGHLKKDCKTGNLGNKANGSGTKGSGDGSSNSLKVQNMFNKSLQVYYVIYVSEAYFMQDDDVACMGNQSTALVHGRGCVDLRLGHVHFKRMQDMSKDGLIPAFDMDNEKFAINSIIESRDAIFDEHRFSSVPIPSQRFLVKGTKDFGGLVVPRKVTEEVVQQPEPELKKPKGIGLQNDPKRFDEAMKFQDVVFWKEAINDEMDSIMGNNSWVLADLPPGCKPLEEVYMNQPQGFIVPDNENKVCKLIKSLYRLKQTPNQWHQKFDEVVLSNGYLLNQDDKCVYSKFDEYGKGFMICLFVDDMLIFGTNQVKVNLTKEFLSLRFSIKDMGEVDVILGKLSRMQENDKSKGNNVDGLLVVNMVEHDNSSRAVVRLHDPKLKTLGERGIECIFIGYAEHPKLLVPKTSQRSLVKGTKDSGSLVVPEKVTEEKEAINDEIDSIMGNNTWVLAEPPPGCKPLGCKWIFKRKLKVDGTAEKFKARLYHKTVDCYGINSQSDYSLDGCEDNFLKFRPFDGGNAHGLPPWQSKNIPCASLAKDLGHFNHWAVLLHDPSLYMLTNRNAPFCQLGILVTLILSMASNSAGTGVLEKTIDYRLMYTGYPSVLEGYTNASWIGNTKENSSTSGWVFLLGGAAGKEAEWLKNLLFEIPLWVKPTSPIFICCDSAATLANAYSQMYNGKSRHLGVRNSMIRELITNRVKTEAHVLQIIPRMCLEPTEKEDEVMLGIIEESASINTIGGTKKQQDVILIRGGDDSIIMILSANLVMIHAIDC
uniref:Zinc finger, CCHC-type n=1 Tax=Tanacetum cinerariifolium TaxID=118510 RepID=A0A6L2LYU7_TANCI|nr:zinc finger, CCHC-type [Tanacetum cinerariifolium]